MAATAADANGLVSQDVLNGRLRISLIVVGDLSGTLTYQA
jgi:hypothetical protein